jgi:hypothetical protein
MLPLYALLALGIAGASSPAAAQERALHVGIGAGGTYYCIVSRCDTGIIIGPVGSFHFTPVIAVEAAVRRHFCTDCDRFTVAEAALLFLYPQRVVSPYVGGGVSLSSDPDFMGDEVGLLAAAGAWVWPGRRWGMRVDARGRQVGRGDAMGEVSLALVRRFGI